MAHPRSAWSVYLYIVAFEVNIRICRSERILGGWPVRAGTVSRSGVSCGAAVPYLWADVRRSSLLSVRQTSSSACEAPLRGMRIGQWIPSVQPGPVIG